MNKERSDNHNKSMYMENNIEVAYDDWKQSVLKAIENSSFREYQKGNLKTTIAEIKKDDFEKLQKQSSSLLEVPIKDKYFTFYSVEGETLISSFSCLNIAENKYAKASLKLEHGNLNMEASLYEKTLDVSNIEPEPIGSQLEYRGILILSKIDKGKLISKIGYAPPQADKYLSLD